MNILKQNIDWSATGYTDIKTVSQINVVLSHNLRVLSQYVLKTLPNVVSIYLTGGYASSKGTVAVNGPDVELISDYDLVVVTNGWASLPNLDPSLLTNLKNVYSMSGHPVYEFFVWNIHELHDLPVTKFLYDFQLSQCIYGPDIKCLLPKFNSQDIPVVDGLRLLFNRVFGALIPFSPCSTSLGLHHSEKRHLTFEAMKLALGAFDALLISESVYSISPTESFQAFQKIIAKRFPDNELEPSVFEFVKQAASYKLKPSSEVEQAAVDLWFRSRDLAELSFAVSLERLYHMKATNIDDMILSFVEQCPHPLTYNFGTVHNFWNNTKCWPNHKMFYKKPTCAFLAARLYLLFSVNRDGTLNQDMLNTACRVLYTHTGLNFRKGSSINIWEQLKQYVLKNTFDPFSLRFSFQKQISRFIEARL